MNSKPLTELEITVLVALYEACRGSVHAHVPEQAILSKVFIGYGAVWQNQRTNFWKIL